MTVPKKAEQNYWEDHTGKSTPVSFGCCQKNKTIVHSIRKRRLVNLCPLQATQAFSCLSTEMLPAVCCAECLSQNGNKAGPFPFFEKSAWCHRPEKQLFLLGMAVVSVPILQCKNERFAQY